MECPKCGHVSAAGALECERCGVVFAKISRSQELPLPLETVYAIEEEVVEDGRIGRDEWMILGAGFVAAVIAYLIPFTRFVLSALVTLFHEFGHAVAGWLMGYPSIPAFDFVYGGGLTHHGEFKVSIALAITAGFGYLAWLFRENRRSMGIVGAVFLVWLFFVTSEWRREIFFASAGHLSEFILAGILFYKALANYGWRAPELERPLGAFVAFFVQIHSMLFAWRLIRDADFLGWYREGKGGALMNDLEVVALDLQIWSGLSPQIEDVARALLLFSLLPMVVGLLWFFERARWHRLLRSLRTAES